MEEIQLYGGVLSETRRLFNINQHLADWDLRPVEGRGLYVAEIKIMDTFKLKCTNH